MGSISDYIKVRVYKDYREKEYVCLFCGRAYHSRSGARQHVKRKHLKKT
jgi:hypothetical protein